MLVCDFVEKKLIPYYKEAFRKTLMIRHKFLAGFTRPEVVVNVNNMYRELLIFVGLPSQIKGCGCGGLRGIAS